jgi:hypothetical protein
MLDTAVSLAAEMVSAAPADGVEAWRRTAIPIAPRTMLDSGIQLKWGGTMHVTYPRFMRHLRLVGP